MDKRPSYSDVFLQNVLLLEHLQGGIVYSDYDPPFCLRYATEGMAQLSGYSQNELLTMEQMDIVCEDDREELGREVGRQFSMGDTFEVEYRLKRKDGSLVYVLDRAKVVRHDDGEKYIHCLLTDITFLKDMERSLRLSEEKYRLAIQQSGNVIIECDPATKVLEFSQNYSQLFGESPPEGGLEVLLDSGWVAPDQRDMLAAMFDDCLKERVARSMELRLRDGAGCYVWCMLHLAPISHSNGDVYALVGCLTNIHEHKHQLARLTELSQRDGLTGVYNRATMESIIAQHMLERQGKDMCALMIMDIDCFKQINDGYGHAHGDEVLMKLARVVGDLLPAEACLGRLGGDEFLIFFPDLREEEQAEIQAKQVVEEICTAFCADDPALTVSVGVALSKDSATGFLELYKQADHALYQCKAGGRNGYAINR